MLFLALFSITINDETEVLNMQEMSADLYNQIPENLKEVKVDGRNYFLLPFFYAMFLDSLCSPY